MKMEAHKSSGTTKLIKCLCDVLGCRAVVCRSVFPRCPKGAVLAAGPRTGSLHPRSCHVWGSEEPGSGSFRRHHSMIHHLVSFPVQPCLLGSAASQGSVTPHAHPLPVQECSPEGVEMAQNSLSAAVPFLLQQWHHKGCVPGFLGVGKAAFFLLCLFQS